MYFEILIVYNIVFYTKINLPFTINQLILLPTKCNFESTLIPKLAFIIVKPTRVLLGILST